MFATDANAAPLVPAQVDQALPTFPEIAARVTPVESAMPIVMDEMPQAEDRNSFSPEHFDAVVERVIQRMQPQMIEIVTREILRPVVEALVRRELEKP